MLNKLSLTLKSPDMKLVIDGNSFMNVAASIVKNMLREDRRIGEIYWVQDLMNDGEFMLKDQSKREYKNFTLKYLNSITSLFSGLNSVQIVFDSASWRKSYIQDSFSASADDSFDYKGHRKYDDYQYLFYQYFQKEVLTLLEETKLLTYRVMGAEGDDIIARIIETNPNSDFCIWSTDLDFFQLLENGTRKVILICPKMGKKDKKVYTTLNFKRAAKPANSFDIFSFSLSDDRDIITEIEQKGYVHNEIDPRVELIKKILAGDGSDNIPRVHKSMTPKKVEALCMELLQQVKEITYIDTNTDEFLEKAFVAIKKQGKVTDAENDTVKRNLQINVNVIRLKSNFFPDQVTEQIDRAINRFVPETFNSNKLKTVSRS